MTLGVAYPGEMASGLGTALRNYTIQKSWEASAWEQHERQRRAHGSVVVFPSQVAPGEPVVTVADAEFDRITLARYRQGWCEGMSSVRYERASGSLE